VKICNFKALKETPLIKFTEMPVVVGKNDTGKSSILHALDVFFEKRHPTEDDLTIGAENTEIEIEVHFADFSEDVKNKLEETRLLSSSEELVIKKIFEIGSKKAPQKQMYIRDFVDSDFQNLHSRKERELNELGNKYNLEFAKAGRSITNESKIAKLIKYAIEHGIQEKDMWIIPDKDVLREIDGLLPIFTLFTSYINLNIEQAEYQNPFQEMIINEIDVDPELKKKVQVKVAEAIKKAVKEIEENLKLQTDTVKRIVPEPKFIWKKLVKINLEIEDQRGICVPLYNRGMGIQRLVMVALLKYIAEKQSGNLIKDRIFAIEEPETSLHPGAQRELIDSFRKLRKKGYQIIMTSHSPVFASEASEKDIVLVTRQKESASIVQHPNLQPDMVVDELGILPRDQIISYSACLFVEGPSDKMFFETVAKKFKDAGLIEQDFCDKNIGGVIVGGNNLKFYVEGRVLKKLSRKFAVIVDSDKKRPRDQVKKRKIDWQCRCREEGGEFFILRKRELENYLHPAAVERALGRKVTVEDFNDVKKQMASDYDFNKHFKRIVEEMQVQEILERDKYTDEKNNERHEILEIIQEMLRLVK